MKEEINTTLILLEKHYPEKRSNKVRKALKYKRLRLFVLHLTMFYYKVIHLANLIAKLSFCFWVHGRKFLF